MDCNDRKDSLFFSIRSNDQTNAGNHRCLTCGLLLATGNDSNHVCCTCSICSRAFQDQLDLKRHLCSVHFAATLEKIASIGSYPFPCLQENCDFLCSDLNSFTDHFGVFHEGLFDALNKFGGMEELMAKLYPKKFSNFCNSQRLELSRREFQSSSLNTNRQLSVQETSGAPNRIFSGQHLSISLPVSRSTSMSDRETSGGDFFIQDIRSGLEIGGAVAESGDDQAWSNRNSSRHTSVSSLETDRSSVSIPNSKKNNKVSSRSSSHTGTLKHRLTVGM